MSRSIIGFGLTDLTVAVFQIISYCYYNKALQWYNIIIL